MISDELIQELVDAGLTWPPSRDLLPEHWILRWLLQACDEGFGSLTRRKTDLSDLWRAQSNYGFGADGRTPEEALARLFLAIHRQNRR